MTIKDIARESGYSVGTVSRVLNNSSDVSDKARKRIMEVVEKYNFQLNNNAKHLKKQSADGILILIKGTQNMLFAPIVEQMQGLIKKNNYACMIYYLDENDNEIVILIVYTDSELKNALGTEKYVENTDVENSILKQVIKDYGSKALKYKHAFKQNADGTWYWISTEPVK